MSRRTIIQPRANQDIDEHLDYLAEENGLDTAIGFLHAVQDAFDRLLQMPELGPTREYLNPSLANLRMWPISAFPKYLIFYRPADSGIQVIRVIYGTRDIPGLFEDE